jgi:hypothetical protein
MEDLHQYKQRLETASRKIQNSSNICEENKKLAEQFKDWNALRSTSTSRQYRYLSSLKQILEHNDFRLDNLEEDEESKRKIHKILGQIENSEYYSKDYSAKTNLSSEVPVLYVSLFSLESAIVYRSSTSSSAICL